MRLKPWTVLIPIGWSLLFGTAELAAEDGRFDFGFRFNALGADGEPTNDILGLGINGRYRLNDGWWVGFGLDHSDEFDVERTAALVGLRPATELDSKGTSTLLMGWIERVYGYDSKSVEWFWNAGAGINEVDIDPVSGPLEGGGTYTITTKAGSELIVSVSGGLRWHVGRKLALEFALRGDQHLADWDLVDQVSGASATIDDYFIRGLTLGARFRF